MPRPLKIYLAGPDVFLPDAIAAGKRKKQLCTEYGFEGLFPLDNDIPPATGGSPTDVLIYRANLALIRAADLGILHLTPFLGPSADPGTVFELGLLVGLGKPVFGYTNVAVDLADRVAPDGCLIEPFGLIDNLMVEGPVRQSGATVVRGDVPPDERLGSLEAFTTCVELAARRLSTPSR